MNNNAGTANSYLKSNGPGIAPSWEPAIQGWVSNASTNLNMSNFNIVNVSSINASGTLSIGSNTSTLVVNIGRQNITTNLSGTTNIQGPLRTNGYIGNAGNFLRCNGTDPPSWEVVTNDAANWVNTAQSTLNMNGFGIYGLNNIQSKGVPINVSGRIVQVGTDLEIGTDYTFTRDVYIGNSNNNLISNAMQISLNGSTRIYGNTELIGKINIKGPILTNGNEGPPSIDANFLRSNGPSGIPYWSPITYNRPTEDLDMNTRNISNVNILTTRRFSINGDFGQNGMFLSSNGPSGSITWRYPTIANVPASSDFNMGGNNIINSNSLITRIINASKDEDLYIGTDLIYQGNNVEIGDLTRKVTINASELTLSTTRVKLTTTQQPGMVLGSTTENNLDWIYPYMTDIGDKPLINVASITSNRTYFNISAENITFKGIVNLASNIYTQDANTMRIPKLYSTIIETPTINSTTLVINVSDSVTINLSNNRLNINKGILVVDNIQGSIGSTLNIANPIINIGSNNTAINVFGNISTNSIKCANIQPISGFLTFTGNQISLSPTTLRIISTNFFVSEIKGTDANLIINSSIINLSGIIQLKGDSGTDGQVLISRGNALPPVWGSANNTIGTTLSNIQNIIGNTDFGAGRLYIDATNGSIPSLNNQIYIGNTSSKTTEITLGNLANNSRIYMPKNNINITTQNVNINTSGTVITSTNYYYLNSSVIDLSVNTLILSNTNLISIPSTSKIRFSSQDILSYDAVTETINLGNIYDNLAILSKVYISDIITDKNTLNIGPSSGTGNTTLLKTINIGNQVLLNSSINLYGSLYFIRSDSIISNVSSIIGNGVGTISGFSKISNSGPITITSAVTITSNTTINADLKIRDSSTLETRSIYNGTAIDINTPTLNLLSNTINVGKNGGTVNFLSTINQPTINIKTINGISNSSVTINADLYFSTNNRLYVNDIWSVDTVINTPNTIRIGNSFTGGYINTSIELKGHTIIERLFIAGRPTGTEGQFLSTLGDGQLNWVTIDNNNTLNNIILPNENIISSGKQIVFDSANSSTLISSDKIKFSNSNSSYIEIGADRISINGNPGFEGSVLTCTGNGRYAWANNTVNSTITLQNSVPPIGYVDSMVYQTPNGIFISNKNNSSSIVNLTLNGLYVTNSSFITEVTTGSINIGDEDYLTSYMHNGILINTQNASLYLGTADIGQGDQFGFTCNNKLVLSTEGNGIQIDSPFEPLSTFNYYNGINSSQIAYQYTITPTISYTSALTSSTNIIFSQNIPKGIWHVTSKFTIYTDNNNSNVMRIKNTLTSSDYVAIQYGYRYYDFTPRTVTLQEQYILQDILIIKCQSSLTNTLYTYMDVTVNSNNTRLSSVTLDLYRLA